MLRTKTAPFWLTALLIAAVMLLGGAASVAVPACATLALLALTTTGWVRSDRHDPLLLACLFVLGVTIFQCLPLPPWLLRSLHPASAELTARVLAPLGQDSTQRWRAMHLDPGNGWAMAQYLVGIAAAYVASRQASLRGHAVALRQAVAWIIAAVAFLAIAHKITGQTELFGIYRPREAATDLLSPLLNPNHLSALCGVGMILWVGFALEGQLPSVAAPLAVLCGAVCAASTSRGGTAGAIIGLAVLVLLHSLLLRRRSLRRTKTNALGALQGIVGAGVVVLVGVFVGYTELAKEQRIGGFSKFGLMSELVRATNGYRWFGTGLGGLYAAVSHSAVESSSTGQLSEHTIPYAENSLLDLAFALGLPCGILVVVLTTRWLWQNRPRVRSSAPEDFSVFAALVSIGAHDQVDYALWLGAMGYTAAILAGVQSGLRTYSPPARGEIRVEAPAEQRVRGRTRMVALVLAALSGVAGIATARLTNTIERDQWQARAQATSFDEESLRRAMLRHPADPVLPMAGAMLALRTQNPRALRYINRVIELAPGWSQTHIVLAQVLARRGLRSQALIETQLAIARSNRYHLAGARLLLALSVTDDELGRMVDRGPFATEFLRTLGLAARGTERAAAIDRRLLARAPTELAALIRTADRARAQGDSAGEIRAWETIASAHPHDPTGCVGLFDMHLRQDSASSVASAESALTRCSSTVRTHPAYLRRVAILRSKRQDTEGMRRTIDQLLEQLGSDTDKRIEAFALRGELELQLQHESAALTSYELADAMSAPRHPYLPAVIRIATQMGDVGRVRNACMTLREEAELPPDVRERCNAAATGSLRASPTTP